MEKLNIGGRLVGPGELPYIIAEIGSNHNGDMRLCKEMIDSAKQCGADAIKLQSWTKGSLVSKAEYARNTDYTKVDHHFGTLEEMIEKYQLTPEMHKEIADYCDDVDITFLSSVFSADEVELIVELGLPAFKIASMDLNNLPLLASVGKAGLPVFLSTGMGTLGEIEAALSTLQENGSGPVSIMHCIALYPPLDSDMNLNNMATLEKAFDVPIGFSDHTLGTAVPLAAIALGACVVEKHFTTDKELDGWDHWMSADPAELTTLVEDGKRIFSSLGSPVRKVSANEMEKRKPFRRRAILTRDMGEGERIEESDLDYKRPGTGINPNEGNFVIGRAVTRDLKAEDELEWSDLV
jgi:sialic acid synthase SpsE